MPINTKQLIELIIQPTLKELGLYSVAAEQLIAGTAAQETHMGEYLKQINGPALGPYGMEPNTHDDIWKNFLLKKRESYALLYYMTDTGLGHPPPIDTLMFNLKYATAMCRVHYLRVKEALPAANDIPGLASYWKKYYNTPNGAGTEKQFIDNFNRYVKPYYEGK